jgi:NAD(P)-dependent dehydrogenase (short-subunit alcohol dehydrogenase family)
MEKSFLVTGASTGIGRACALHLDRLGFRVYAGVRRQADAESLCRQASDRLAPLFLDVTDAEQVSAAAARVARERGESGLSGLVNNAGVAIAGPLEFITPEELQRQLEVNVVGQLRVTQAVMPQLRQARGRIVNISSVSGRVAWPFVGPYAASKFALEALSDALRVELRPWGISVSVIEPGNYATEIWDKSLREAEERLARMPAEVYQLYGGVIDRLLPYVRSSAHSGGPVEQVVQVVAHALLARRPRARYLLPRSRVFLIVLVNLLPVRLRDRLFAAALGIR